jgi:HEAT repeat protein
MGKKFDDVLQTLGSAEKPLPAKAIYGLSDLNDADLKRLGAAWGAIPLERRRQLIRRVVEAAETNFDMDFTAVTRLALTDLDDEIREVAVEATWTDESPDMLRRLMTLASGDRSEGVRAAAASALGRYILEGELGKFDPGLARQAENIAIKLYQDESEDVDVRRRALEAIANSGRKGVTEMIEEAYRDDNPRMRTSAIFAMGRSCDSRWSSVVLRELISESPEMRYEAARAAGELELRESVPYLADLLQESDREIMQMAIWALGEIGGTEAQRLLEEMIETADEAGDDDLVEALEEALSSANLVGGDLEL